MVEPLRVAVIGRTGKGNYGHGLDTVWADVPETRVIAVADEHEAGRKAAQERLKVERAYADYREMLDRERPQIVAIAPRWIDQHAEMALAAAEHGCHMYMEKPFVPTLQQADEVIRACEMRHLKLAMSHQSRYSPAYAKVKQLLSEGVIGTILEVRGRGKEDQRGGGEDLWVLGSHVLDLMQYFCGRPTSCEARVTVAGRPIEPADVKPGHEGLGPLAGDRVEAEYELPNGVRGYFSSMRGQGGNPSRFGLQIFGSRGVVEVLSGYGDPAWLLEDPGWSPGRSGKAWRPVTSAGIGQPEPDPGRGLHHGNVRAVNDLLAAIKEDRQPLCGMYDAQATTEMILAAFASQRVGGRVALPLVDREHPLTKLTAP
jgi:predicted dehydrogenase